MPQFFVWKKFLVLALGQAAHIDTSGDVVWLSSKDHLKVHSQPGSLTLYPVQKGRLFLSGIKSEIGPLQEVLIISRQNFAALRDCRKGQDLDVCHGNLCFRGRDSANLLKVCPFDDLAISQESIAALENDFLKAERNLSRAGHWISSAAWRDGKRWLVLSSVSDREAIKSQMSPDLAAFYDIEIRSQVRPGRNLIFELTLFEFSRNRARKMGLRWPQSVSLLSLDSLGRYRRLLQDTSSGSPKDFILQGDFGESQGVGRILAQPTLRTQPGVTSRFISGGEFPIKSGNALHSHTSWKSYGLKIDLTPEASSRSGDSEVGLDFKLEFSEPNMDQVVEGTPGLIQRQLESRFEVRTQETTILTTMLTLREGKGREGIAILGQIPILSLLFAGHSRVNNDSELWFALRPTWEEIPLRQTRELRLEDAL